MVQLLCEVCGSWPSNRPFDCGTYITTSIHFHVIMLIYLQANERGNNSLAGSNSSHLRSRSHSSLEPCHLETPGFIERRSPVAVKMTSATAEVTWLSGATAWMGGTSNCPGGLEGIENEDLQAPGILLLLWWFNLTSDVAVAGGAVALGICSLGKQKKTSHPD